MVQSTSFRTPDGLRLEATYDSPATSSAGAALLVHGAGVTREEGGFFTRLSLGLSQLGIGCLRFDLPGHGESEGRQEDLTISSVMNSIKAGFDHLAQLCDAPRRSLIAASFSGGAAIHFAAHRHEVVDRLVLLNPLIDYQRRFVEEKRAWVDGYIDEKAGRQLLEQGYVGHTPTFKIGRPMLNEVFWLHPRESLSSITAPTLIVHGTQDTFIPVESSKTASKELTCENELMLLDGAQHGFAVHDDPEYADPQSQRWQSEVIDAVGRWTTD